MVKYGQSDGNPNNDKKSISSSLSMKIIRTEKRTCYLKNIEEYG